MSFKHKRSKEQNKEYIQKTYSLILYPNKNQEGILARFFGASRYLYNKGLELKIETYKESKQSLTYRDLAKFLTSWRHSKEWIKAVSCSVEQQSLIHLETAFKNFFRRIKQGSKQKGFPRFKSCRGGQSFEYPAGVRVKDNRIYLPCIGWIKYKNGRDIQNLELGKATIIKTVTGVYKAQVLIKTSHKIPSKLKITDNSTIGIDLGLHSFAVLSNGSKIENPNFFKRFASKLRLFSRRLSRTQRGSKNRIKARFNLSKVHEKLSHRKQQFLNDLANKLVDDNQATCFKLESLNIQGMLKNHNLARSIQNASWNQFVQLLTYKAVWRGKTVEKIPMLYPSSRLCNRCDYKNHELKLKDRAWICLNCGANHDRDINAAVNIRNYREGNSRINASGEGKLVKALVERRNPVELQKLGSEARKCFQGIVTFL